MTRKNVAEALDYIAIGILAITALIAFLFGHLSGGYEIAVEIAIVIFWIGIFIEGYNELRM
jgi:uncharacterized membrane protein